MAPMIMAKQGAVLSRGISSVRAPAPFHARASRVVLRAKADKPNQGAEVEGGKDVGPLGTTGARELGKNPVEKVLDALTGKDAKEAEEMDADGLSAGQIKQKMVQNKLQEERREIYGKEQGQDK